jgi:hypothetical protein
MSLKHGLEIRHFNGDKWREGINEMNGTLIGCPDENRGLTA